MHSTVSTPITPVTIPPKKTLKSCDDCKFGERRYCDGLIYRDWSGHYEGDIKNLPIVPDNTLFWTFLECQKNNKGLKFLNLIGDCSAFVAKP